MSNQAKAQLGTIGLVLIAAVTAAATRGPAAGDAEAIATIIAIDSGVIIHADLAMTKKLSDPVLAYAQDIRGDHSDDADAIAAIAREFNIDPASTAGVRALEADADDIVRKLDELDGPAFEKAYLDAMVTCHVNALATFDRLTRLNLSGGVKAHLKHTREDAQKHLANAKTLRS